MFDLITGDARHLPRHQALPIAISTLSAAFRTFRRPPPPPPPARRAPVLIGGQITQPKLLHRVDPVIRRSPRAPASRPPVILEALVAEEGHVAVRPERVVLTVVLTFRLEQGR